MSRIIIANTALLHILRLKASGGSCFGNVDFCPWAGIRELPECLYLSLPPRPLRRPSGINLPKL
jgi:hypothetical protein